MYLISPTEPLELRNAGQTSSVPESYGCDIFWPSKLGLVGVQRKEVRDLVNSVHDGRLNRELAMMNQLAVKILLIEGDFRWTNESKSLTVQSWSMSQQVGLQCSVQLAGCWLIWSKSLQETISLLSPLHKWTNKEDHGSLSHRPNPTSQWGQVDNRDWGIYLLQSFPGIGYKVAGQIYDFFGGVPLEWTVDSVDLMDVPGIGPGRAAKLIEVLEKAEPHDEKATSSKAETETGNVVL